MATAEQSALSDGSDNSITTPTIPHWWESVKTPMTLHQMKKAKERRMKVPVLSDHLLISQPSDMLRHSPNHLIRLRLHFLIIDEPQ